MIVSRIVIFFIIIKIFFVYFWPSKRFFQLFFYYYYGQVYYDSNFLFGQSYYFGKHDYLLSLLKIFASGVEKKCHYYLKIIMQ